MCLKYTLQEIHLHIEIHPHFQVLKNKAVRKLTRVLEIHVARNHLHLQVLKNKAVRKLALKLEIHVATPAHAAANASECITSKRLLIMQC